MTALAPSDEHELAAVVADAAARKTPLAVNGGGTRTGLGRPVQAAATLTTAKLAGVTLYEPSELVVSAKAGTPLAEIETLLATHRQRLAFEPPDYRGLYGSGGEPTIGAVAAANLSGPRRIQAGAARDSLIGVRAVTGAGTVVKSGGRVMKNVTGYDLVKFLAGSYGTLGVMTEVTFKVQPLPETEATLALTGLADDRAIAAMAAALGSPYFVTGAAHSPADESEPARTYVRIDGFAASVAERAENLRVVLADFGTASILPEATSRSLWLTILDLDGFSAPFTTPLWRVSVKPSDGPSIADAVRRSFGARILYDWGGGLIWIAGGEGPDAGAAAVRAAVAKVGGHATLVRADESIRNAVEVFEPQSAPVMALTRKLKATFDPAGILNPGRMYAGV
ncbi:MAG TPA: glycolate oxidase subunit GlcE [Bauldia sp.]|nr:glycolate oxidase subunit GlcE [Bauldia sp.]